MRPISKSIPELIVIPQFPIPQTIVCIFLFGIEAGGWGFRGRVSWGLLLELVILSMLHFSMKVYPSFPPLKSDILHTASSTAHLLELNPFCTRLLALWTKNWSQMDYLLTKWLILMKGKVTEFYPLPLFHRLDSFWVSDTVHAPLFYEGLSFFSPTAIWHSSHSIL